MKTGTFVTGLLTLAVVATGYGSRAMSARQPRVLEPTPLEALVQQPGARTVWSKFIGRLDGGTASAIVTAIEIRGPAGSGPMRGVRIDLRHEGRRPSCEMKYLEWSVLCDREQAAVFIEEDRLESFRTAVLAGRAEVHPGHRWGVTHIRSSLWGTGILISGYNLYGPGLSDLAELLTRSAAQLQTSPR